MNGTGLKILYRVEAPHFVAGIVFQKELAINAAPILKWSIGKNIVFLRNYFNRKKWRFKRIRSFRE
jgi:hypothetical protein